MSDGAIALGIFGGDKAVLATDVDTGGVHTFKVTTNAASNGIVVEGFGAAKYVIGTVKAGGLHTLCATTNAANAAIALQGAGGEKVLLGAVSSGVAQTIAVTTGAANSSVLIDGFGSGLVRLATVLTAGVHTLAVTAAPDNGFAISSFAAGESVIAAAKTGGIYSLALSGLYDPDAAAYFAAAGISDSFYKAAINQFIVSLKTASLWSRFDRLWLFANQNSIAALTCMVSLQMATPVNNPNFTAGKGLNGNGTSSYLNSNFSPAGGVNYTISDAAVLIDIIAATEQGAARDFGTSGSSITMLACNNGGSLGCDVNTTNSAAIFVPVGSTLGALFLVQRTAANAMAVYRNNSVLGISAAVSASPAAAPLFIGCRNISGTPSVFSTRQYAMFGAGASLDGTQRAAFQAARDMLKSAIGW